ncbi:type II toxin-antitoxin system RelE/ParE family toxin [Microbacteriaceae bacterium K1510]|nr:type II toxin-antitoxin system RelE/ParE family toxin [Microbacteriaceae bacterium K1510]
MRVYLSEDADADLLHIHSYLAERNPVAAVVLARAFTEKFSRLSRFPFIGRDRSHLISGIRSLVVGNYVIFYRIEADQVTVLRILDGRRDIDSEFQR